MKIKIKYLLLALFIGWPLTGWQNVTAQYMIDRHIVEEVTQKVKQGEQNTKVGYTYIRKKENIRSGVQMYIARSFRNFLPELEISFDKEHYQAGDDVTITIRRVEEVNRRTYTHRGEFYDEGPAYEKLKVSMRPNVGYTYVDKQPHEYDYVELAPGESMTVIKKNITFNDNGIRSISISGGSRFTGGEAYEFLIKESNKSEKREGNNNEKTDTYNLSFNNIESMNLSLSGSVTFVCFTAVSKPAGGTNISGTVSGVTKSDVFSSGFTNVSGVARPHAYNTSAGSQFITIEGGALQYEDVEITQTTKNIDYAVLTVFESDNQSKLLDINALADEHDFDIIRTDYEIVTSFDGSYNINIDVQRDYFRMGVSIARRQGFDDVYQTFRIVNDQQMSRCFILSDILHSQINISAFDPVTLQVDTQNGIRETLRRSASIADRLNQAFNVGVSDDLKSLQTVYVATKEQDSFFFGRSFATVFDSFDEISFMQIGSDNEFDLSNAVVLHEYGHTLQFATRFDFSVPHEAGGRHYLNNLVHPQVAYSEGWANFWATQVTNDPALYSKPPFDGFGLDLNTVRLQNFVLPTGQNGMSSLFRDFYTPADAGNTSGHLSPYDGVESEAMVAAAFWEIKNTQGIFTVWNAIKSTFSQISNAAEDMLQFFAANSNVANSFYSTSQHRAHELGFGKNFSFFTSTAPIESDLPQLPDLSLVLLGDGDFQLSNQVIIDQKSIGIFGSGAGKTTVSGNSSQNTFNIRRPNNNEDWVRISDLKVTSGDFGIDALWTNDDALQTPLYLTRNIIENNLRGVCAAGDLYMKNNFMIGNNGDIGILYLQRGTQREVHVYNNLINQYNNIFSFDNSVAMAGGIANNMIYNNDNFAPLAHVEPGSNPNRSGISFTKNGTYGINTSSTGGMSVSDNLFETFPSFGSGFLVNTNFEFKDGGLQDSGFNVIDFIFSDRFTGNFPPGQFLWDYGSPRNWVGAYGGAVAYKTGSQLLPSNFTPSFKSPAVISHEMVWGGEVDVNSDVRINAGSSLTILPGTIITFDFNKKIIVDGGAFLKATGSSDNPITFTYKYPQEFPDAAWDRIQLFGDGNRFEYVIFEYGLSPLDVRSRDNLITHSTFRNNKHGIDSWKQSSGTRSQFRVLESAFENHTSRALRARHADASIEHSRFTNELWNGGGIYVYASTLGNPSSSGGYFRRNEITDNRSHGLQLDVSAIVYDGFGSVRGGNLIYGNDKHEIYLSSSTSRLWTSTGGAHSNIHSNDSYKYIYNLAQTTSGENLVSWTVTVENNWWGSSSGPSSTDFFGSVDYSPFLSTPTYQQGGPTSPPPSSVDDSGEQLTLQPAMSAAMAQAVTAEAQTLPEKERLLWVEQRLGELKELWLNGDRDERRARWLNGMASLWQELPPGRRRAHADIPGYLRQSLELLMNAPRMELLAGQDPKAAKTARLAGEAAMLAEMNRQLEENEPRQALFLDEQYRPYLQNLDHRRERMLLAVAAHEELRQYGQALALLDPLRELAREGIDPEGASLDFIQLEQMLSERVAEQGRSPEEAKALAEPVAEAPGQTVDNTGSGLPESFEIEPAYPNPFNPSTQIVFALPERGDVRIRVYDIAGRLVSVLANQTFDAGRHQLTFDAGRLASGIYLIRGNAAGEVFTQRVTLIK